MRARAIAAVCAVVLVSGLAVSDSVALTPDDRPEPGRWCTGRDWGPPRAIPERGRQQRVAARALASRDPEYVVKRVAPTHFGVIALVAGDVAKARRELPSVDHVRSWTAHFLSDLPPGMRMGQVKNELLAGAMGQVQRRLLDLRDIAGRVEEAYWPGGGAIVVEWKAPVPPEITALSGPRRNGAEVRVVGRPYSQRELDDASRRLLRFVEKRGVDWSQLGACSSAAGLELGVPTRLDQVGATQAELDEAAGMHVLVVPRSFAVAT